MLKFAIPRDAKKWSIERQEGHDWRVMYWKPRHAAGSGVKYFEPDELSTETIRERWGGEHTYRIRWLGSRGKLRFTCDPFKLAPAAVAPAAATAPASPPVEKEEEHPPQGPIDPSLIAGPSGEKPPILATTYDRHVVTRDGSPMELFQTTMGSLLQLMAHLEQRSAAQHQQQSEADDRRHREHMEAERQRHAEHMRVMELRFAALDKDAEVRIAEAHARAAADRDYSEQLRGELHEMRGQMDEARSVEMPEEALALFDDVSAKLEDLENKLNAAEEGDNPSAGAQIVGVLLQRLGPLVEQAIAAKWGAQPPANAPAELPDAGAAAE